MWKRLLQLLHPFSAIAQELAILRELYELDLSSRNPPIIRVTESPKSGDTMVTYTEADGENKTKLKEQLDEWNSLDDGELG